MALMISQTRPPIKGDTIYIFHFFAFGCSIEKTPKNIAINDVNMVASAMIMKIANPSVEKANIVVLLK